jgi:hypothetical protein
MSRDAAILDSGRTEAQRAEQYPCPRESCSGRLTNAVRYQTGTVPLRTRICWDCGWEQFPLPCCNQDAPAQKKPRSQQWRECETCGGPVYSPPWMRKHGRGRFCSHACHSATQIKQVAS